MKIQTIPDDMRIPWEEKIVYLPVNLNRMSMSPDSSDALAVEIAEPSPQWSFSVTSGLYVNIEIIRISQKMRYY
ncbi:MAG: hypothetical protein ABFR82_10950 [Nitrospirota bacterium]